jgi:antitoxin ParD1/3/4
MQAQKISISLAKPMYDFVENYQEEHCCKSRSEVVDKALHLLQQAQLESCYKEANKEIVNELETMTFDGLEHETW